MKTMKRMSKLLAVALLLAGLVAWGSARVGARPTCPGCTEVALFGMVGLTDSQTARLNVVNTATAEPPVIVAINFINSNGQTILNSDGQPYESTLTLAPGQSGFLDLNTSATGRLQFRAKVVTQVPANLRGRDRPDPILPTLEVFDSATGKTCFVANSPVGPNPRHDNE